MYLARTAKRRVLAPPRALSLTVPIELIAPSPAAALGQCRLTMHAFPKDVLWNGPEAEEFACCASSFSWEEPEDLRRLHRQARNLPENYCLRVENDRVMNRVAWYRRVIGKRRRGMMGA